MPCRKYRRKQTKRGIKIDRKRRALKRPAKRFKTGLGHRGDWNAPFYY